MTASASAATSTVRLRDPGQLLAALPHLLGFRPADSVLVIAHARESGGRVGNVVRADLPPRAGPVALARRLREPLLNDASAVATVALVGGTPSEPREGPPHRDLVEALEAAFVEAGHHVAHALWVAEVRAGLRWSCYDAPACTGLLPDPGSTEIAAVAAHAGIVTYGSRGAMERQLDPTDPEAVARRAVLLDRDLDKEGRSGVLDPLLASADRETACGRGLEVVRDALARSARGEFAFSDTEIVRLAVALSLTEVRDICLASALPPEGSRAATAERLWLELVRQLPAPERAQAACLLAYSAYVRGEGALAGMAIDNALRADPGHVLAALLNQALGHAIPPGTITRLGATCDDSALWRQS